LEEHKRRTASFEAKGEQDFMDIMLSILDGKELEGYDADTINKATCLVRSPFSLLHGALLKGPCLNMNSKQGCPQKQGPIWYYILNNNNF